MILKSFMFKPLAAAALLAVAGASNATITVYTSLSDFNAATSAPGTDGFDNLSITHSTASPITRSAGGYGYTAAVSTTSFYGAGTSANPWLSTNTASDTITFNGFTGGVGAIGGNFFTSDIDGLFAAGDVTLTATDAGGSVTQVITGSAVTSFLGFSSDTGAMVSLTLAAVQPDTSFIWPTADNLVLAVSVPEPQTYALMMAGLGLAGLVARRRRG